MKPYVFVRTSLGFCTVLLFTGCIAGTAQTVDVSNLTGDKPMIVATPFVRQQLRFDRVREAREASETVVEKMFRERNISYPAAEMYVRVFKSERVLELWVRPDNSTRFELLRTYPICALAGLLGPKKVQGDRQVPEGFYSIDLFNPESSYHLSLRINYPNQRDRAATTAKHRLGGDIFIHGGCKSDGCLAITDEAIQELYWVAVMARGLGQRNIPVHIFPARLDGGVEKLKRTYHDGTSLVEFWETLKPGYDYFQKQRRLPEVGVDARGQYRIARASDQ
ncbi:MAG: L,D-transpeptidase family protein [Gemmatimonadota bacterium]